MLGKLARFREGGERSDRRWRDVLGILETQSGLLDDGYLDATAREAGLSSLLRRARADVAHR